MAKVLLPPIFSNLHNFKSERDTTNEHKINLIDICSIYRPSNAFVSSLSVFKLERFETFEREQYFCY